MKAGPLQNKPSVPLTFVDGVCERFETACKAAGASGAMPSPETYLEEASADLRPELLCELLKLEMSYSKRRLTHATNLKRLSALSTKLAPLKFLELIGRGGMGRVYKAEDGQGRIVAVKVLPREFAKDREHSERFEKEAKVLARLEHENIVALQPIRHADDGNGLSCFMEKRDGIRFYVMEYAQNGNLRTRIIKDGVGPVEAMGIIAQVCRGLQHAHDANVIHRDIKPENILIDRQGQMKIADFGLAKVLDSGQTRTRQVMGTPDYMAPEQKRAAKKVDCRADVYSLGVVFYELLTGQRPTKKHLSDRLLAKVDKWLHDIVLRTMAPDPDSRFQRVDDLIDALQPGLSPFVLGNVVRYRWKSGRTYFPGKITGIEGNKVHIEFDDGDKEWTTVDLIVALETVVRCRWKGRDAYYQGKITAIDGNRIHIEYDDGDKEWTTGDMIQK